MLCLSDPRGPTTEKECIPPLEKLWRHLAQGGAFPPCELVGDMLSSEQTEIPPTLENEAMESFDLQPDEPETETPEGLQDAFEPSSGDIFLRSSPKK